MKNSENEKIERIEQKLLSAQKTTRADLNEIVSRPELFSRITAGIKAEQINRSSKPASGIRTMLTFWNWKTAGVTSGILAVCFAGLLSLSLFTKQNSSDTDLAAQIAAPDDQTQTASSEDPESSLAGVSTETKFTDEAVKNKPPSTERIVFKNKTAKPNERAARSNLKRKIPRPESEIETGFYPLNFAGDFEKAKEDGKIIRVELSRSSLLALGLNPPPADEIIKVKTDLLIGSDGVARGIRFVK